MAIRLALGAGRLRLIRQLLVELVAGAGRRGSRLSALALGGRSTDQSGSRRYATASGSQRQRRCARLCAGGHSVDRGRMRTDSRLASCQNRLNQAIKESGRTEAGGVRGKRLRGALVVAEVALSLTLLIGAGLMVRSFMRVQGIDPGLQVEGLVTMRTSAPRVRYPEPARVLAIYGELVERVKSAPEVVDAAVSSALPTGWRWIVSRALLSGGRNARPTAVSDSQGQWNVISPGYFRTSGVRLLAGRDFDEKNFPPAEHSGHHHQSNVCASRLWGR